MAFILVTEKIYSQINCSNQTIKTKKQDTSIKPAFRQYFMMQHSPQEHIRLTSLKSYCHFSFAEGGGPNTSVTLQMA